MVVNDGKKDPPELYLKEHSLWQFYLKFHWTFDVDIHSIEHWLLILMEILLTLTKI